MQLLFAEKRTASGLLSLSPCYWFGFAVALQGWQAQGNVEEQVQNRRAHLLLTDYLTTCFKTREGESNTGA